MTAATKPKVAPKPAPEVSHIINHGGERAPFGEVYFRDNPNLIVAFGSGRVWLRKGGFGVREPHYRAAYAYLIRLGVRGYVRFARDRVGKPS